MGQVIRRFGILGVGMVLGAIATVAILWLHAWMTRDRWDQKSITGIFEGVMFSPEKDRVTMLVDYQIRNDKDVDYPLPASPEIMVIAADGKSLYSVANGPDPYALAISLTGPKFIPAHRQAQIRISTSYGYNDFLTPADASDPKKLAAYFSARMKRVGGFEIYDHATRHDIRLPAVWPTIKG